MNSATLDRNRLRVARAFTVCWLFGWFINAFHSTDFVLQLVEALDYPIRHPRFPESFTDPELALLAYLAPAMVAPVVFTRRRNPWRAAAVLMAACAAVGCLHLQLGSDATFVTSWWTSLWLIWFLESRDLDRESLAVWGAGLAHSIVGLMFLGALMLKLTPDYRSGVAFYGLYFTQEPGWPYTWLRKGFANDDVRLMASWFSRAALSGETMLALSPFLPTRFVLPFFTLVALVMLGARSFQLISVHASLFGVLVAAWMLTRHRRADGTPGMLGLS